MGQSGPKHVGVNGCYNIIVTLTQLYTFVGLNSSNLIVMYRMENVKYRNLYVDTICMKAEI
jgi:hypothetical protein